MNKDIYEHREALIGEIFKGKSKVAVKINNAPVEKKKEDERSPSKNYENYNPEDEYLMSRKIKVNKKEGEDDETKPGNINTMCPCYHKEPVTFYCRKCKEFICKFCRYGNSHINHKTIMIDTTKHSYLEDSVRLYCSNIQADIGLCLRGFDGYSELFSKMNLLDFSSYKKTIQDKISDLDNKVSSLKNNLPHLEKGDKLVDELNEKNKTLNKKIESILEEVKNLQNKNAASLKSTYMKDKEKDNSHEKYNKEESSSTDALDILEEVSTLEFEIENLSQRTLACKINYDIHKYIENMYNNILKSLDTSVFSEKYSFSLDFDIKETKIVPTEITGILRQTANSKGNSSSTSIQNLIHFAQTLKLEMDEQRKKDNNTFSLAQQRELNKRNLTTVEKLEKEIENS